MEPVTQEPARLKSQSLRPGEPALSDNGRNLDLKVIFTDRRNTAAALATARAMAHGLGARITLMVAQVVPYPLPLAAPPVPVEFTARLLESMAMGPDDGADIEIYLCRDRCETLRRALAPDSLVILGAQTRWWLYSWERTLVRLLRREGLRVLTV